MKDLALEDVQPAGFRTGWAVLPSRNTIYADATTEPHMWHNLSAESPWFCISLMIWNNSPHGYRRHASSASYSSQVTVNHSSRQYVKVLYLHYLILSSEKPYEIVTIISWGTDIKFVQKSHITRKWSTDIQTQVYLTPGPMLIITMFTDLRITPTAHQAKGTVIPCVSLLEFFLVWPKQAK